MAQSSQVTTSGEKYIYLWVVALISFGIGILTGFGVGFKRFAPELVDQFLTKQQTTQVSAPDNTPVPVVANTDQPKNEVVEELTPVVVAVPPAPVKPQSPHLATALEWLTARGFNEFGDPVGTVYAGGSPIFDEATGQNIDHYDFLVQKFSGTPWL